MQNKQRTDATELGNLIDHKIDQLIEEKQVLIEKVLAGKIKTFRVDSVSELAKELLDIL